MLMGLWIPMSLLVYDDSTEVGCAYVLMALLSLHCGG
jgi:hypothetical protein